MHTYCCNILDARNQPISFNIVKTEPAGRISPFGGPSTSVGNFSLQSARPSSQSYSSMQTLRYVNGPNEDYKVEPQIKVRTWKRKQDIRVLMYLFYF